MHLLKLFFLVLTSLSLDVLSQSCFTSSKTSILPVTKDTKTSLYSVTMGFWGGQSDYLIDLDAPFTWQNCVMHVPKVACAAPECLLPIQCHNPSCIEAQSYINPTCPSLNITDKYGCRVCTVTPINPVSESCKISQLTSNFLSLSGTNGKNPSSSTLLLMDFKFSCAPSSLKRSFPKDITGVAAFSWSALALPGQLLHHNFTNKFALCLPSSSSDSGVVFLGEGPFYFLPFPNLDITSILSYTPMIRNTSKSLGYYIRLNRISISGTPIPLPLLNSNTVKLSTVVPYTTLRSDIYNALFTSFSKATKNIPRVKALKPFSLCLKASAIGSIGTGFRVPKIDLEMESGKNWTIYGDNSMKLTGNRAACFAFIDGGLAVKDAIVIGTFQMENNFLFFDMENQSLGFSSSLFAAGTSCSNFNFTATPE